MKPRLYLLTHGFPFGRSEAFLESESPIVAEDFDITFVPVDITGEQRPIPVNATIDTTLSQRFAAASRKRRAMLTPTTWSALMYDLPNHRLNIRAMRRINSFVSDALATAEWCRQTVTHPDSLVYTYWMTGKTHGLTLARDCLPQLKIVTRAHRFDLYDDRYKPAFWPLRQKTISAVDRLFVISEDGMNFLSGKYKIHSGVLVSRLGAMNPGIRSIRSTDGILRIVSCSSFLPQKRVEMMAEMIATFAESHPNKTIHWKHFGDGPLRAKVVEFLNHNSPANLETDFPGAVSNQAVLAHYREHPIDVFLNLSDSEGIPVSIMEAQACGILVLATNVGGVAEIVDKHNGFLVDENVKKTEFESILSRICENENLPTEDAIVNSYQARYDAESNYKLFAQELVELYHEAN